jgi:hypothetical protein
VTVLPAHRSRGACGNACTTNSLCEIAPTHKSRNEVPRGPQQLLT